jgi:hypothetical protein
MGILYLYILCTNVAPVCSFHWYELFIKNKYDSWRIAVDITHSPHRPARQKNNNFLKLFF